MQFQNPISKYQLSSFEVQASTRGILAPATKLPELTELLTHTLPKCPNSRSVLATNTLFHRHLHYLHPYLIPTFPEMGNVLLL